MLWQTSPACTEVEAHVLDWMVGLLADRFVSTGAGGGVIQDSASSATLCAVIAARERALGRGAALDRLVVYASVHAHSALEKGARVAGLRLDQVRLVEADDARPARGRPGRRGRRRRGGGVGCRAWFMATVGTTSSLAVDPVDEVATVAERPAWLHVGAAMAGSAAVCPELRFEQDGLAQADSYVFNPHKWLFTPFDCSCFLVADAGPSSARCRSSPSSCATPPASRGR